MRRRRRLRTSGASPDQDNEAEHSGQPEQWRLRALSRRFPGGQKRPCPDPPGGPSVRNAGQPERRIIQKGPCTGRHKGFPLCGRCVIQRDCKIPPINKYKRQLAEDTIQYIGNAKDEQERLIRLDGKTRVSLLEKYGIEEDDTFEICRKHGLLSPIYEFTDRGGCFFCPNAKEKELRHLYDHHRDLWNRLLALQKVQNKATELFNRDFRFDEIDAMFKMDDMQMSIFDFLDMKEGDSE